MIQYQMQAHAKRTDIRKEILLRSFNLTYLSSRTFFLPQTWHPQLALKGHLPSILSSGYAATASRPEMQPFYADQNGPTRSLNSSPSQTVHPTYTARLLQLLFIEPPRTLEILQCGIHQAKNC